MPQPPRKKIRDDGRKPLPVTVKGLLTAGLKAVRPDPMSAPPEDPSLSFDERLMNRYPYNPERLSYNDRYDMARMLDRDQRSIFPSRTDVSGDDYPDHLRSDWREYQNRIYEAARTMEGYDALEKIRREKR